MTIAAPSPPLASLPPPPPLSRADAVSLFLDFDGTLVEIADRPQDVVVSPDVVEALARLSQRLDGRVAVVSGRSLAALDHLLGAVNVAMAGSHGGEFRPAGAISADALAEPLLPDAKAQLEEFGAGHPDLTVETKPFSAAIHYRTRPDLADYVTAFGAQTAEIFGLVVKSGKMVIELSMPGSDKGNAVRRFLTLPPFAGSRPLFVGDDVTDEDAFRAIRDSAGGGILVGPMRPTLARWRLDDVAAVHRWLKESA